VALSQTYLFYQIFSSAVNVPVLSASVCSLKYKFVTLMISLDC